MNPLTFTTNAAAQRTQSQNTPVQTAKSGQGLLGKDDFLKLMMVELKNQNPLDPNSDPTQYMQQLAQFTALEQQTNTAQSAADSATQQHLAAAMQMLGHTVTYTDASGAKHTGSVQKVDVASSGPTLTVGGVSGVDPASVGEIS